MCSAKKEFNKITDVAEHIIGSVDKEITSDNVPSDKESIETLGTDESEDNIGHSTIKTLLTNPISYTIIDSTIKLYNIVRYSIRGHDNSRQYIKTFLSILNSEYGPAVLNQLLEYGGYTYYEMQINLMISKGTISYITTRLRSLELIESRSVVNPISKKTPGSRPNVWVLKGTVPEVSVNAIKRYYELKKENNESVETLLYIKQVEETSAFFVNRYMGMLRNIPPNAVRRYIKEIYPDLSSPAITFVEKEVKAYLHNLAKQPKQSSLEELPI